MMPRRQKKEKNTQDQISDVPKLYTGAEQLTLTPANGIGLAHKDTPPITQRTAVIPLICQHFTKGAVPVECKGHRTGLLTGDEIKKYGIIVEKDRDDENCLKNTSYDLRLGEGHMIYDAVAMKWLSQWASTSEPPLKGNTKWDNKSGDIIIPRYGMALIQLRENIDLLSCLMNSEYPAMICGHFDLKLQRVAQGLISQQATQVEPGYQGKLFCYLFNHTKEDIVFSYNDSPNDRIATIEFQYVSCISQCSEIFRQQFIKSLERLHAKFTPPYCSAHGIDDVRYFGITSSEFGKLPRHGGLSSIDQRLDNAKKEAIDGCREEIKRVSDSRSNLKFWLRFVITTAITIICALGAIIINNYLSDHSGKEIRATFEEVKPKLNQMKREANEAMSVLQRQSREAQSAYDLAKAMLSELDGKMKAVLKAKGSNTSGNPVISDGKAGKEGNK